MGKLKLDKTATKLVRESIAHWKRDIRVKLKSGVEIINDGLFDEYYIWVDDKEAVPCHSNDCPLCKNYIKHDCVRCPYWMKYGMRCDSLHWGKFIDNPCLETCNKMIKALENILK